jgi:hypothetical protein
MEIIIDVDKVLEEAGFGLVRLPGRAFHATLGRDQGDVLTKVTTTNPSQPLRRLPYLFQVLARSRVTTRL